MSSQDRVDRLDAGGLHLAFLFLPSNAQPDAGLPVAPSYGLDHLHRGLGVKEGGPAIITHKRKPTFDAVAFKGTGTGVLLSPLGISTNRIFPKADDIDDVPFQGF